MWEANEMTIVKTKTLTYMSGIDWNVQAVIADKCHNEYHA